jgi:hypothetical protein
MTEKEVVLHFAQDDLSFILKRGEITSPDQVIARRNRVESWQSLLIQQSEAWPPIVNFFDK